MSVTLQNRYVSACQAWSKIASVTTILVGGLVLVGWWLNSAVLKSIVPGLAPMKANTAVAFLGAGLTLWLLQTQSTDPRLLLLRRASALLLTCVGLLTLSEYIFGWQLGIDQLLVREATGGGVVYPGRMAPVTALNFLLLGVAFLLLDSFRRYHTAQLLTLTANFFALLGFIGYLYGVESLYRMASYTATALPSAITFLILCLGMLLVRPDQGWMAILTSDSAGGVLARHLLPAAVVVPILLGWVRLLGQRAGLYDTVFGLALFASATIVVFTLLIAWSAASLLRIDDARQQAEANLRRLYAELEERVLARTTQLLSLNQQLEREVAERQHVEADLRESQERFAILFRSSPVGITLTRLADGHYLDANESFLRLVGLNRDEVIGHSPVDVGLLADAEMRRQIVQRIREQGTVRDLEVSVRIKSGEVRFFLLSVERVEVGDEACGLSILYDITERKQAEAALRESEERFAILFRNSPAGIALARLADGSYLDVNESFLRLVGFDRAEVIGHTSVELGLLPAEAREKNSHSVRKREIVRDFEISVRVKSGAMRLFLVSAERIEVGDETCSLSILYDITERKRVEQESQRLKTVLDQMAEGAQLIGFDWRYIYVNEVAASQGLRAKDELVGHTMMEMDPSVDQTPLFAILRRCMDERVSDHFEHLFTFPDNTTGWFDLSIQPVPEGIFILSSDITERKRTEAALRESEERFAKAFRSSPAALTITRLADSLFIDANENFLSLFGYSREETIGHRSTELSINTNPDERAALAAQALEQGSVHNYEIVLQTKSSERRNMLMSVDTMELEGEGHILTTLLDITDRKRTEAALAQEGNLMQALMDNIPDTIYFKDTTSRFTRINRAQAHVLGVGEIREAIGKTDADFQAPHLAVEFYAEEQQLFQSGQPIIDRQEFNPTSGGQPRWFSTTKVPMFDQHRQVIGLIGISRDITERIKAEAAVSQANAQLTERVSQMALLNELQEQLQACGTIQEVYQVTAHLASQLFPTEGGALYVINHSRPWVETAAAWGVSPLESQVFGLEDCWALRSGRTHRSDAGPATSACLHWKALLPSFSICMPLLAQGEALGVLHLRAAPDADARPWEEAKQQLAQVVADSVALALANLNLRDRLREQSIRDPLTALFNRRYMEESLGQALLRAAHNHQSVGIIMLDIDHFKRINDTHGHSAGDAILHQLGHFLKEHTRDGDVVCRYGGEEFTLILPETTLKQTQLRAEQLRQAFKALSLLPASQSTGCITLSFGVAAYPEHGQTGEDVLQSADVALYRAKHDGRDRVAVAEEPNSATLALAVRVY